jgi:hypothetical protein
MLSFYPLPNRPGTLNNYFSNPRLMQDTHKGDVRIDHTFSEAQTLYGRFSYQDFQQVGEGNLPPPAWGGGDPTTNSNKSLSFVASYQRIFTPNLFNTLKIGYNRLLTERLSPLDRPMNEEIGIRGTGVCTASMFRTTGRPPIG